jgi:hypothetical protein
MKTLLIAVTLGCIGRIAIATQADDVTITVTAKTAGATPFLSQITLAVSDTTTLKNIQFTISPKAGSSTRPLSATYSYSYLAERGDITNGTIFLPVYGLYDNYTNSVTLTYTFNDGSSKQENTTIATQVFDDPCGYESPMVLQARTTGNSLSYDYILLKGLCSPYSPGILDTDGNLRWVGTANLATFSLGFFENSVYIAFGSTIYRNDLDGTVTQIGDYSKEGVIDFHHTVDRGKFGLLFEIDTATLEESIIMEIGSDGTLLQTWNMADIISAAMTAGGDDPTKFVVTDTDWFHNNAAAYNRADDTLVVSSRENFVIGLDYKTGAIKWILGDPTKAWYQFPSLKKYALTVALGSLPPIGQHAVSITYDQDLLLFDNGTPSFFHDPPGAFRAYAAPRKYHLDLVTMTATEVWNYPMDKSVNNQFCGSVYEDLPLNYLVDYADDLDPSGQSFHARILGLDGTGAKIFDYEYATVGCTEIFNAAPLHLENIVFPAVGPQSLNISTRGEVGPDQLALIGGFIVTGTEPKTVVLRALGPSLVNQGIDSFLADPVITLYDSTGQALARNDDWQNGGNASQITADGLAPSDAKEAALRIILNPGAYTAVVTGNTVPVGTALVEVYDLSPTANSKLANISTRAFADPVSGAPLIGGFIVGANDSSTVIVRAIGPSLSSAGITNPLADPSFTVYDQNGSTLGGNDNWQDDPNVLAIEQDQIAPKNNKESATILHLPPGPYTAVVQGVGGGNGVALVEVYNLE